MSRSTSTVCAVPSDSFDANNVAGIQNVEVLLGPQSTLGGRTAASGLINLTTRGPTDEARRGFVSGTLTDDNEYRAEAFISRTAGQSCRRQLVCLQKSFH